MNQLKDFLQGQAMILQIIVNIVKNFRKRMYLIKTMKKRSTGEKISTIKNANN